MKINAKIIWLILIIIGVVTFFLLTLIASNHVTLNSTELSIADLINTYLVSITLLAVYFTSMAAISTKESTDIMNLEMEKSHLPKLIPIDKDFSISMYSIYKDIDNNNELEFSNSGNFNLEVMNVHQGNAYKVCAWFEIEMDAYSNFNANKSTDAYEAITKEKYNIVYNKNTHLIYIEVTPGNPKMFLLKKDRHGRPENPILKPEKAINIDIPSSVSVILSHLIYEKSYDLNLKNRNKKTPIKLHIEYKTNKQLEDKYYTRRSYKVEITTPISPTGNDISFSIGYEFINEENVVYRSINS